MSDTQGLTSRQKKELKAEEEKTIAGKFYVPDTDVFESDAAITMVMEMPGVSKEDIDISLEQRRLSVQGRISFDRYRQIKPAYTEYNIGHFSRHFMLSSDIDTDRIQAGMADGVLSLTLPKAAPAELRKIRID